MQAAHPSSNYRITESSNHPIHEASNPRIIQSPNQHDPRLSDTLLHEPQYIERLMQMPDSTLSKKLSIIRQQMQTAFQNNLTTAYETLLHWERQIIQARYLKNDFEEASTTKPTPKRTPKEEETPIFLHTQEEKNYPESKEPIDTIPQKTTQLVLFG